MAELSFFDRVATHTTHVPDVLSCIANLSNDEVFTPPEVVNKMLDMLPQELFADPNTTFLDPATKTGVFLREIAKRCLDAQLPRYKERSMEISEKKRLNIPLDDYDIAFQKQLQEKIDHIFHNQLFGIGITELTSLLARRSLYCSKYPNGPYSITHFDDGEGNIRFRRTVKHSWEPQKLMYDLNGKKIGKCAFCGATRDEYDRGDILESHAYEFIHTHQPEEIFKMQFDVIIGNPPYQLSDGGNKNSAKPIYQHFVQQAMKMNPRYISMIIPARWYAGGKGLDDFRSMMLTNNKVSKLVDFSNAKDCFQGISLGGGVCYFLWSKDSYGECEYTNIHDGVQSTQKRNLNEFPVFVRYNEALSIIHKVLAKSNQMVSEVMGGRNPFGFESFARGEKVEDSFNNCKLYYSGGIGYVPSHDITKSHDIVDKYKVMISRATSEHAGEPDSSGMYNVLSVIKVLKPHEVCTDSYLIAYSTDDEKHANNCAKYILTKFFRFLVLQSVTSISLSKEKFQFVPMMDFSKEWTDALLYEEFNLTDSEIEFIESMIKEKQLGGDE